MATDLERLIVRLEASLTQFDREMKKASGTANKTATQIESRFAAMNKKMNGAVVGAARSFLAPFLGLVGVQQILSRTSAALNEFSDLLETAQTLGLSTDFYQTLTAAGLEYGATQEQITGALEKFTAAVGQAKDGTGSLVTQLKLTNPELLRQIQSSENMEQAIRIVSDAVNEATEADEKAVIGKAFFGRAWADVTRVIGNGSEALDDYAKKAREMGLIVDRSLIERGDEIADQYAVASRVLDLQFKQVLIDLAPAILAVTRDMGGMVKEAAPFAGVLVAAIKATNQFLATDMNFDAKKRAWQDLKAAVDEYRRAANASRFIVPDPGAAAPNTLTIGKTTPSVVKRGGGGGGGVTDPRAALREAERMRDTIADTTREIIQRTEAENLQAASIALTREETVRLGVEQDLLNRLMDGGVPITDELRAKMAELAREYAKASEENEKLQNAMAFLKDVGSTALRGFVEDLREGTDAMKALENVLDRIADKLIELAINKILTTLLQSQGGQGLAAAIAPAFHAGGIVGESGGMRRRVSPAIFAGAPRFHGGLVPGEYPAILKKGEAVLTPRQQRGMGGGRVNVTIQNFAPVDIKRSTSRNGDDIDFKIIIDQQQAENIASPRSASNKALRQHFGLAPSLIRT
jgi:hypothetical protein